MCQPPVGVLLLAMSIVRRRQWGPVIGRERRRVRPVIAPASCPRRRSNSDHAGKCTYSDEIESLDRDPGIVTLKLINSDMQNQKCCSTEHNKS